MHNLLDLFHENGLAPTRIGFGPVLRRRALIFVKNLGATYTQLFPLGTLR